MDVLTYAIKYAAYFLCGYYAFAKLNCFRLKWLDFLYLPVAAGLSAGLYYVTVYASTLIPICLFALFSIVFIIRFKMPVMYTFEVGAVAFGISIFAILPATMIMYPIINIHIHIQKTIYNLIIGILQILITFIIFSLKKFKRGIPQLKQDRSYDWLLFISVNLIFACILSYTFGNNIAALRFSIIGFLAFLGLSLLLWWRKLLSADLRTKLQEHAINDLENVLATYENKNSELTKQNEELAKIIHRDNKLLPSMQIACREVIYNKKYDQAEEFMKQVDEVYSERAWAIEGFTNEQGVTSTGVTTLDCVNEFLAETALKQNTEFDVEVECGAVAKIKETFTGITDLNTLLCDLGENALIAVRKMKNGKVKIVFEVFGDVPRICIYDNGEPFDGKVIFQMGRRQITTHRVDGGSGIGLFTAFEILRKYSASLYIDETVSNGFTKCVIVAADGKNSHGVKTDREIINKICKSRSDFKD